MKTMILPQDLTLYISIGLLVILIAWIIRLEVKLHRVLLGKNAKTLEDSLVHLEQEISKLGKFRNESEGYFKNIEKRISRSVQGVATVRFNAFKGEGLGGNQSFSTALINEDGDGAIISTLSSRERTSVFAKPLNKFNSEIELSGEEEDALARAKNSLSK